MTKTQAENTPDPGALPTEGETPHLPLEEPGAVTEPSDASEGVEEVEGEVVEEGPEETPAPAPTAEAIIERAAAEIEPMALADLATEEQITRAVARIVQRARAIKKFRASMLAMTNVRDWYAHAAEGDDDGNPYLAESGCEKIINAFQIEVRHDGGTRNAVEEGGYEFVYQGEMRALVFSDIWYPVVGSRWSDDGFFTRGGTCTADPGDVRKAAWTNWMQRGIKTVCGLKTITWDELEKLPGLKDLRKRATKIDYRTKGGGPAAAPGELHALEKGAHIKVKIEQEDLTSRDTIKSIPAAERFWNKSPNCFYWVVKWSKKNFGVVMDAHAVNSEVKFKLYNIPKDEMP